MIKFEILAQTEYFIGSFFCAMLLVTRRTTLLAAGTKTMTMPTQEWTREDVLKVLSEKIKARLNMSLPEFSKAVRARKINECDYAELIALMHFLADDDPAFAA